MKKVGEVAASISEVECSVVSVEKIVTITMDLSDAEVLYRVVQRIAGDFSGPRGATERISNALYHAGVKDPGVGGSVRSLGSIELS